MPEELIADPAAPVAEGAVPMASIAPVEERDDTPSGWSYAIVWALIVLAVLIRFYNINSPIVEAHAWRQTQTAFTVWTFLEEGISMSHYQSPVLGPPWLCPYEYPVYQATAAVLAKALGITSVDLACRLTNLLYFFLSASLLYLIVRFFSERRMTAVMVLLIYLWSPFMILWSRTAMIEFAAVTFGLAYFYCFILWLHSPRQVWLVAVGIACACLGATVKSTSMAILVPPMIALACLHLLDQLKKDGGFSTNAIGPFFLHTWLRLLGIAAMFMVPLIVGQYWTHYADNIKLASPATAWNATSAAPDWFFGTWSQRASFMNWHTLFHRMAALVLPYGIALLPAIAFVAARHADRQTRVFLYSCFVSVLLPLALFFNLFLQHDYYLCAIAPVLAILAGYGADYAWNTWLVRDKRLGAIAGGAAFIGSFLLAWPYLIPAATITYDNFYCKLGEAIQKVTPEGEYVVMMDFDTEPSWLYYAKRKGYLLSRRRDIRLPNDFMPDDQLYIEPLKDPKFTTLVCAKQHDYIFNLWREKQVVASGQGIIIIKVRGYVGPGSHAAQTSPPPPPRPATATPWSFDR